jgi:ABC-type phosphate/phosphonate transport system ATPase subunit
MPATGGATLTIPEPSLVVLVGASGAVRSTFVRCHRTINIDTGCVFGGCLTALRYPERECVSVPAARPYYVSAKPVSPAEAIGDPRA